MTGKEISQLAIVGNDIKWLIEANKEILEQFNSLAKQVQCNTIGRKQIRAHINIQWWIITAVIIAEGLKVFGIF